MKSVNTSQLWMQHVRVCAYTCLTYVCVLYIHFSISIFLCGKEFVHLQCSCMLAFLRSLVL